MRTRNEDTLKIIQKRGLRLKQKNPKRFALLVREPKRLEELYPTTYTWIRDKLCMKSGCLAASVLYLMTHPESRPVCQVCGKPTRFRRGKFLKWCSGSCASSTEEVKAKRHKTNLKLFGGPAPMSSEKVKAKAKKTRDKDPLFEEKRRQKREATSLRKYGVPNPAYAKSIREKISLHLRIRTREQVAKTAAKIKASRIRNAGSLKESYARADVLAKKTRAVKYGSLEASYQQALKKANATMKERYGAKWALQNPELFEKQQASRYRLKQVTINGRQLKVQGFEPLVLKRIEKHIDKIEVQPTKMPPIWYRGTDGKMSRYFPDALIKTAKGTKVVLEVKSDYTLWADAETNRLKFKAAHRWCKEHGFVFVLAVVRGRKRIQWIVKG